MLSASTVVILFGALFVKHFVCDFLLQWRYQYLNKGTYGHPGGILHVAICLVGTMIAFVAVLGYQPVFWAIAIVEAIVHYHIDWAKVNVTKYYGLAANKNESFWWLVGFDQMLHYLTYVAMVAVLI